MRFVFGITACLGLAACATPCPNAAERYLCEDGSLLLVRFQGETALVTPPAGGTLRLEAFPTASGFGYGSPALVELRGQADEVSWTAGGRPPRICRAVEFIPARPRVMLAPTA